MEKRLLLLLLLFSFIFIIGCAVQQLYLDENPKENESVNLPTKQLTPDSVEERHWKRVFAKAFETVDCPAPRDPSSLLDGYYKGPMIDTHIHLQSLPDGAPGGSDEGYVGENLGIKKSMEEWICMLDVEGTKQAWGFFPVWKPIIEKSIDVVNMTMEKYPNKFIPFIMPPDADEPTVIAEKLEEMLNSAPGLFQGYGEIGLYGNPNSLPLAPDSRTLVDIYPVVRKHNLIVYVHLGEGHKEALERAAQANPDIIFVFHGDQLIDCAECDNTHKEVAEILENHPNVYYGVDEIYAGEWLLKPGASKETFLKHFADYTPLLEADLAKFKEFIEAHPDQVLFGTDRGVSATWDKDPDVALVLNNYARAFIDRLDPSVREKFAYKNAEKLIENR